MPLTYQQQQQILKWYCLMFYLAMAARWYNGLLLTQLSPTFFNIPPDGWSWLLMQTGIHLWLVDNTPATLLIDALFLLMPAFYLMVKNPFGRKTVAIILLMINLIYISLFVVFPTTSVEGSIAWLLFPALLIATGLRSFWLMLHALRYFLLYFFASAGIWKLIQGGVWHTEQMSGILLYQHKEYLVSSPAAWFTQVTYWLIDHPGLSYILYLAATLLELSFIIGFFTHRLDGVLLVLALLFLVMDVLIMRIHYWEIGPLLLTLYYSRYSFPPPNHSSADTKPLRINTAAEP